MRFESWVPLFSGVTVGLFALTGVFLAQRFEHQRAHADRVWKERAETYLALWKLMAWVQSAFIWGRIGDEEKVNQVLDTLDQLYVQSEVNIKVRLYASNAVAEQFEVLDRQIHAYYIELTILKKRYEAVRNTGRRMDADQYHRKVDDLLPPSALARQLQTTITTETRTGNQSQRRRRRPAWLGRKAS